MIGSVGGLCGREDGIGSVLRLPELGATSRGGRRGVVNSDGDIWSGSTMMKDGARELWLCVNVGKGTCSFYMPIQKTPVVSALRA